jgi:hypothetical protein
MHGFDGGTVRSSEFAGGRYMSWKRQLAAVVISIGFGVVSLPALAEDPPPPKDPAPPATTPTPAATPAEAPKKKDPFFGDRFAMYLETRGGSASIDTIDNSVTSGLRSSSVNNLDFGGMQIGQFTVGWTLPRGRGQYLLTYTGTSNGSFELDATGFQASYQKVGDQTPQVIGFQLPWWQITARDGLMTATKTPPVWNSIADDTNENGVPDPSEIRYPATTATLTTSVPEHLGNRIQTWDLVYRREFGGVRIRSRWTAGLRYLTFDGAIVTPAWVTGASSASSNAGFGYTDGALLDPILMQQSTKGWGPVGSGEIQFNFFRQRLTLYALVQAAFILESLDTDSGTFTYMTRDPSQGSNSYFPGAGHIEESVSKSSWNTTFEAGLRVRLLEGFNLILDWNTTGYLDTMLLPTELAVPDNASQIALGTTARFVSRDYVVSSINLGLSFQF